MKLKVLFVFLVITCAAFVGLVFVDVQTIPYAIAVSNMNIQTRINAAMNTAVQGIIVERGVSSQDFYRRSVDEGGRVSSLSVNTVLINEICSAAAVDISSRLTDLSREKIKIPIGSLSGIGIFSNMGPSFTVSLTPVGTSLVNYGSSMDAAGINQIHFQVWLTIESTVMIVNPFQTDQIVVTRKMPLVNAVITGEPPQGFYNYPVQKDKNH